MRSKNLAAALHLLDGRHWLQRSGGPLRWKLEAGVLEVVAGSGDVLVQASCESFQLHLEFWLPLMPGARGQERSNGGVYLDGSYELQLLDSAGQRPALDTCGALYERRPPDYDAALPPECWQTLDVAYRRQPSGAQITALLNGILIHNQVVVTQPTPAASLEEPRPAVMLQDHGAALRFRNIWLLPTP